MWDVLAFDSVRLPLNPAIEVSGVDVKVCFSCWFTNHVYFMISVYFISLLLKLVWKRRGMAFQ